MPESIVVYAVPSTNETPNHLIESASQMSLKSPCPPLSLSESKDLDSNLTCCWVNREVREREMEKERESEKQRKIKREGGGGGD